MSENRIKMSLDCRLKFVAWPQGFRVQGETIYIADLFHNRLRSADSLWYRSRRKVTPGQLLNAAPATGAIEDNVEKKYAFWRCFAVQKRAKAIRIGRIL
jgi:hypothetical protein